MLGNWLGARLAAGLQQLVNHSHRHHQGPKQRRTCLSVETLEGRWVPATSVTLTVGPNINISKTASATESENAIVINPTNTKNLFATSTSGAVSSGGAGYKYSMDGGATWQNSNVSALGTSAGDQQMAWDRFGNLFMVQLSTSGNSASTVVGLSTNGGASFSLLLNTNSFGDQPSIAVGPNSVWVDYCVNGDMEARGASVTGLGAVGSFGSAQQFSGLDGTFGDIAVGPNGQVMMVYQEQNGTSGTAANAPSEIYYSLDPDGVGGMGFSATKVILTTNCGSYDAIPNQPDRTIGAEANLAWDRTTGVHKGRVYLVYTEENVDESDDMDVMVRFSDNNGSTWSAPVRVNDDALGNKKSQFNPAIAVDQTTGDVAVTWYDARNSANNARAQIFGSVSRDGGVTWSTNVKIAGGLSDGNTTGANGGATQSSQKFNWGDYDKMDFHAGVFYRAWADNSNNTGDNPAGALNEFDLMTAQVTVPPPTGGGVGGPDAVVQAAVKIFNPVRYRLVRRTNLYHGQLTLLNTTGDVFVGPVYVIFNKLRHGVSIANATGFTKTGKPYLRIDRNINPNKAMFALVKVRDRFGRPLDTFFRIRGLKLTLNKPV